MTPTVQQDIYNGFHTRYNDRRAVVTIFDRPKSHGLSHYELRRLLEIEGSPDRVLVIDS